MVKLLLTPEAVLLGLAVLVVIAGRKMAAYERTRHVKR